MNETSLPHRFLSPAALAACLLALAACGDKSTASGRNGQWVAKVDDREITVHQVNAELNGVTGASPEASQRRAVATLVDRRLLVDAAIAAKQDRDPETMQAIELAKDQIIAQAYLRKTMGTPDKPTADEVSAYFKANPALFAQRRQYEMRQLALDPALFDTTLQGIVEGARSLDEIASAFAARNVVFAQERVMRTSAELPAPMRAQLDSLAGGRPFVLKTPASTIVATLTQVGDIPLGLQEATPQIEQALAMAHARELATEEVARLRQGARIEYKDGYGPPPAPAIALNARSDAP